MAKPCVLLTGFGPFPGVADNPSGRLAKALAARIGLPGIHVHSVVLPTEWEAVATHAPRLHAMYRPRLVIHFGVEARASGVRLERTAHNRRDPRADVCGAEPDGVAVLPGGCDALKTRLPVASLAASLRANGHDAHVSNSCGRYLCNDLYYRSLSWTQAQGGDALFVHIPLARAQKGGADDAAVLRAAEATVRLAAQVRSARSLGAAGQTPRLEVCHD